MGRRTQDEYHRAVMGALDALERTIVTLNTLTTLPERIANIQKHDEELEKGNANWCSYIQGIAMPDGKPFTYDETWDASGRRSTLGGHFPEPRPVCIWVLRYYEDTRTVPDSVTCLRHLRGERVDRPRIDPKVTKRMERGSDVESARGMAERFDGAA